MCKCTPAIRTPFCGKPGCEAPAQANEQCTHGTLAGPSPTEIVESLIRFTQHAELCAVSQWKPTDAEDFDVPDCTCGLNLLEMHGAHLARTLAEEEPPPVTWPLSKGDPTKPVW